VKESFWQTSPNKFRAFPESLLSERKFRDEGTTGLLVAKSPLNPKNPYGGEGLGSGTGTGREWGTRGKTIKQKEF